MHSQSSVSGAPWDDVDEWSTTWLRDHPQQPLHLYACVDAAQDVALWRRLRAACGSSLPLLGTEGDATELHSPHVLHLGTARAVDPSVRAALQSHRVSASLTLLASAVQPDVLQAHFQQLAGVQLSGGLDMILAFWDPAILGALLGQHDDDSLHVSGPVLTPAQRHQFLGPVLRWWYCDRHAQWHIVAGASGVAAHEALQLSQEQEDLLVEASVPDQILYHIELNQPMLFDVGQTHGMRYEFIKAVLQPARQLGLQGMRDLVNFAALCIIYRRRMQTDPEIASLLDQVQRGAMTLDEVLPLMPQ